MPMKKPDDEVGQPRVMDHARQTAAQAVILGTGEEAGQPEPKTEADWAARGAAGGEPGRPPVALGGNSAGQGDRMAAGGATSSNEPASNPKTRPGHGHEA